MNGMTRPPSGQRSLEEKSSDTVMALNSAVYAGLAALIAVVLMQLDNKLFNTEYSNVLRLKVCGLVALMVYGALEWLPSDLVLHAGVGTVLGEPIQTGPAPF